MKVAQANARSSEYWSLQGSLVETAAGMVREQNLLEYSMEDSTSESEDSVGFMPNA